VSGNAECPRLDAAVNFLISQRVQDQLKLILDPNNQVVSNLEFHDLLHAASGRLEDGRHVPPIRDCLPSPIRRLRSRNLRSNVAKILGRPLSKTATISALIPPLAPMWKAEAMKARLN
jgi:hypothetical protein